VAADRFPRHDVARRDLERLLVGRDGIRVALAAFVQVAERDVRVDVFGPVFDGESVRGLRQIVSVLSLRVHLAEAVERHREVVLVLQRAEVARLGDVELAELEHLVAALGGAAVAGIGPIAQGNIRSALARGQRVVVGDARGVRAGEQLTRGEERRDEDAGGDTRKEHGTAAS